jgi:hypothetical protein
MLLGSKEDPMKLHAVLIAALFALSAPTAQAGRFGGPASGLVTVAGYDSVSFDVPFNAGEPAVVSIAGSGTTILNLYLFDGNGAFQIGAGVSDHKTVSANVVQPGLFRIIVRNGGPYPSTFRIATN